MTRSCRPRSAAGFEATAPIADDREIPAPVYRYLAAQGFESDRILKVLNARRSRRSPGSTTDAEIAAKMKVRGTFHSIAT
jgi:hypothetical protein